MTEITMHQLNPNSLVYYEVKIGNWSCEGDALDFDSAMKCIKYDIKWSYRDYENEMEAQ